MNLIPTTEYGLNSVTQVGNLAATSMAELCLVGFVSTFTSVKF